MNPILTDYTLSRQRKRELVNLGAKISPGDVTIVDLTAPNAAVSFLDELAANPLKEVDPVIQPTFGVFGAVTPQVQQEVFNIISTYEPLLAANLQHGHRPPIAVPQVLPAAQAWQFHHAQMAIVALTSRLANPGMGANTHIIHNLPPAAFICELSIVYANAWFVLRIVRTV